jgi:hypothetical protein
VPILIIGKGIACQKEANMEIKLNSNIDSVARLNHLQSKASRPVNQESALSEFGESKALEARLDELPDVRSERVQHAQKLIGDPEFPPRETIQRLAALLAIEATAASGTSE